MPRATWPIGISGAVVAIGLVFLITVGILTLQFHVLFGLALTELSLLMAALLPVIWWTSKKPTETGDIPQPQNTQWIARIIDEIGLRPHKGLQSIVTDIFVGVAIGLFTLVATIPITILWRWLLPPPQIYFDIMSETLTPTSPIEFILWIIMMIVLVGFCEEVFARGVIQQGAENHYGARGGLVLGAGLFALIHLDPWRFLPLFFMSLNWGYMFQLRKWSLYVPWAAHATNNIIAIVVIYFAPLIGF